MTHKSVILNLVAFMFCAILPMTPIMASAVYNLSPGCVADYNSNTSIMDIPLRSLESERWDLLQIKAPDAWNLTDGGQNVVVAVLDTGIDADHPALRGKVIDHVSFTTSGGFDTQRGHGTHVAGLIAAEIENNNRGLAYNARLLDVKVAENDGTTDAAKVARGIFWAVDHGARVINVSLVISQPYAFLESAVKYAWNKGCVIIAAAGNSGLSTQAYPAAYPHVIAVAATDKTDALARWSNRGDWVDVSAPGVDILSTLPDNKYGIRSGSSFSSALVSGEAALLFARVADWNDNGGLNDEVENAITGNCDPVAGQSGPQKRINVYNAALTADLISGMLPHDSDWEP
jgi:thermitase